MKARAAIYHGPKQPLSAEEIEIDAPMAHEVLVRNTACGVCHSDLHFASGAYSISAPCILGHGRRRGRGGRFRRVGTAPGRSCGCLQHFSLRHLRAVHGWPSCPLHQSAHDAAPAGSTTALFLEGTKPDRADHIWDGRGSFPSGLPTGCYCMNDARSGFRRASHWIGRLDWLRRNDRSGRGGKLFQGDTWILRGRVRRWRRGNRGHPRRTLGWGASDYRG